MKQGRQEELEYRLSDEIIGIELAVSALGSPQNMQQRSLIARYGKLLLLSQRLMQQLELRGGCQPSLPQAGVFSRCILKHFRQAGMV